MRTVTITEKFDAMGRLIERVTESVDSFEVAPSPAIIPVSPYTAPPWSPYQFPTYPTITCGGTITCDSSLGATCLQ